MLCLTAYMVPKPVRSFIDAVKEVLGESAGPATTEKWRQAISDTLGETAFSLVEVAVTKLGRSQFAVAYIRPDAPASAETLDHIRALVSRSCQSVHEPNRMEIIYTGNYPYA